MSEVIRRRIDRGRITAEAVFIPTRFQAEPPFTGQIHGLEKRCALLQSYSGA